MLKKRQVVLLVMMVLLSAAFAFAQAEHRKIYHVFKPSQLPNDPAWELLVLWDDSLYYWECNLPNLDFSETRVSAGTWRMSGKQLILSSYLYDSLAAAKCLSLVTGPSLLYNPDGHFGDWHYWMKANSQMVAQAQVFQEGERFHSLAPSQWTIRGRKLIRLHLEYGYKIVLKPLRHEKNIPKELFRPEVGQ